MNGSRRVKTKIIIYYIMSDKCITKTSRKSDIEKNEPRKYKKKVKKKIKYEIVEIVFVRN